MTFINDHSIQMPANRSPLIYSLRLQWSCLCLWLRKTAVLDKYLNDEQKIFGVTFSLMLHRILWVFHVQRNPRISQVILFSRQTLKFRPRWTQMTLNPIPWCLETTRNDMVLPRARCVCQAVRRCQSWSRLWWMSAARLSVGRTASVREDHGQSG